MSAIEYVVEKGDCLSSIAQSHGYASWKDLWNAPENESLKKKRKNPNVLYPGDVVMLPQKPKKKVKLKTGEEYELTVQQSTAKLRLQFLNGKEPLKDTPFDLTWKGGSASGTTNGGGELEAEVPMSVKEATLQLGGREFALLIGGLDPANERTGAESRLRAAGIAMGTDDFENALYAFQSAKSLELTGQTDPQTTDALETYYGC